MHPALADAYARVKDRLTEAEFRERVEQERAAFDGLLDDEALALLVLDELGANDGAYLTLAELAGRDDATVRVTVDHIEAPREFQRGGRPPGRLCGCTVSDATGRARLVLWERDVEKVEDGTLYVGARVTVVNARVKNDRWGLELHVSPWTALEVEGALDPAKKKLLQDVQDDGARPQAAAAPADAATPAATAAAGVAAPTTPPAPAARDTLVGRLLELSPTRTFRNAAGGVGFVCDLDLETDDGQRARVVLWNEPVRQARQFLPGARVRLTELERKPRGAAEEWHTTDATHVERAG